MDLIHHCGHSVACERICKVKSYICGWEENYGGPEARAGLGTAIAGKPGPFTAITDGAGIEAGTTTLISGDGPLVVGKGPHTHGRYGDFAAQPRQGPYESGGAKLRTAAFLRNDAIDLVFNAVVETTEEAVIDSMACNQSMVGRDGNTSHALPLDQVVALYEEIWPALGYPRFRIWLVRSMPAAIAITKVKLSMRPKTRLATAGPGQNPLNPQPTPKRAAPPNRFASMSCDVGNLNDGANKGAFRLKMIW